jgi:hypothetical protein
MQLILFALPGVLSGDPAADRVETVRYVRPSGAGTAFECAITVKRTRTGSSVESVTERGKVRLTVSARYDDRDRLTAAEATLGRGDGAKTATVAVVEGKATVKRDGQAAQEFDVPPGTIVTSAPDWTDTVLLCRRYDRTKGGKQSFPGLWIHPEQAGQRLTFAIERAGQDSIDRADNKLKLDRYTIWLRGNSQYAAWADETGRMIKLVPLPYKEKAANWLVAEGYQKPAAGLWPQ